MPSLKARQLRNNLTEAERILWQRIRFKQIDGFKFRRQVKMDRYIVDFYCSAANLIVEVDGGQHAENIEYDNKRTAWLNARGHRVIRFWNNEVHDNIEGVLEQIHIELHRSVSLDPPSQPSPARREGVTSCLNGQT
jgi:very-short-patch-repair endonuclease